MLESTLGAAVHDTPHLPHYAASHFRNYEVWGLHSLVIADFYTTQSEIEDFTPGAQTMVSNCRSLSLSRIWLESVQWFRLICFCCSTIHTVRHRTHYVKTWRHSQNRKYIMYHNAVKGELSHDTGNTYKNSPERVLRSSPDLDPDLGWPWKSYHRECLIGL